MENENLNLNETPADAKPVLAEVAVYNEDALLTMSERMQSNELDLIITSPPYFNARDYSQYKSVQDYLAQMKEIFTMAYDRLKESRMCVVNISPVLVQAARNAVSKKKIIKLRLNMFLPPSYLVIFQNVLSSCNNFYGAIIYRKLFIGDSGAIYC